VRGKNQSKSGKAEAPNDSGGEMSLFAGISEQKKGREVGVGISGWMDRGQLHQGLHRKGKTKVKNALVRGHNKVIEKPAAKPRLKKCREKSTGLATYLVHGWERRERRGGGSQIEALSHLVPYSSEERRESELTEIKKKYGDR